MEGGPARALYRNTAEWLEAGEEAERPRRSSCSSARSSQATATAARAVEMLAQRGVEKREAEALLEQMPRRYLLENEAEEIAAHLRAALRVPRVGRRLARVEPFRAAAPSAPLVGPRGAGARSRRDCSRRVAGVLSGCGHNILAASAYTTRDGLALDLFHVDPIAGGPDEQELERERIEKRLARGARGRGRGARAAARSASCRARCACRPPSARVDNDESDFYTIIDVEAMDRPGLLHDIARTLSELGLSIVAVRASTRASRATDAFYVTDADDQQAHRSRAAARGRSGDPAPRSSRRRQ